MPDQPSGPSTAPAAAKKARFVDTAGKVVPLDDALEFEGKVYDRVHIARLTIGSFRAHTEAGGKPDVLALPMFHDAEGKRIPAEVMEALSLRDANVVTEEASGFLSPQSRDAAAAAPSASAPGAASPAS